MLLLGGVTVYALNQSDRIAQQLGAAGTGLTESQRLAKSASQAMTGSVESFPDVADSAGILGKTVRGLQSGDDTLRLAPLDNSFKPEMDKVSH